MSGSRNLVIILGHLGRDPELKYTPGGAAVCNFSVATSEKWKDKQEQMQERTEWHRIVAWNKTAENCEKFLKKGRQVLIEGKLQTRSWDDTKSGEKRSVTEIVADKVVFLGGGQGQGETRSDREEPAGRQQGQQEVRGTGGTGSYGRGKPAEPEDFSTDGDDSIPF